MADNLPPRARSFLDTHTLAIPPSDVADKECTICLETFENEPPSRIIHITGCEHVFGTRCLKAMLKCNPGSEKKCPLCRTIWIPADPPGPGAFPPYVPTYSNPSTPAFSPFVAGVYMAPAVPQAPVQFQPGFRHPMVPLQPGVHPAPLVYGNPPSPYHLPTTPMSMYPRPGALHEFSPTIEGGPFQMDRTFRPGRHIDVGFGRRTIGVGHPINNPTPTGGVNRERVREIRERRAAARSGLANQNNASANASPRNSETRNISQNNAVNESSGGRPGHLPGRAGNPMNSPRNSTIEEIEARERAVAQREINVAQRECTAHDRMMEVHRREGALAVREAAFEAYRASANRPPQFRDL